MALSLDEALGVAALDESDKSIHIDLATRQVVIPESEKLFGVESDDAVEVKHIVIDGRYTDAGKDISELSWRVNFRNANGDKNVFLVTKVTAGDSAIEFDWLIRRSVVAYKGTVDFVVCAFGKDTDGNTTPEWNSTLGHGEALEGLEVDVEDIGGDEILDELKNLQVSIKALSDSAAKSASDALDSKNAAAQIETEVRTLGDEKKKAITDESTKQQEAIKKKGSDTLASIPEDYQQLTTDVSQLKEDIGDLKKDAYMVKMEIDYVNLINADGSFSKFISKSTYNADVEFTKGGAKQSAFVFVLNDKTLKNRKIVIKNSGTSKIEYTLMRSANYYGWASAEYIYNISIRPNDVRTYDFEPTEDKPYILLRSEAVQNYNNTVNYSLYVIDSKYEPVSDFEHGVYYISPTIESDIEEIKSKINEGYKTYNNIFKGWDFTSENYVFENLTNNGTVFTKSSDKSFFAIKLNNAPTRFIKGRKYLYVMSVKYIEGGNDTLTPAIKAFGMTKDFPKYQYNAIRKGEKILYYSIGNMAETTQKMWSISADSVYYGLAPNSEYVLDIHPFEAYDITDMTLEEVNSLLKSIYDDDSFHNERTIKVEPCSIDCWGDSLTYGAGVNERLTQSYGGQLERLLAKNGYSVPVNIFGVGGETSTSICYRQGGIPLCVEPFTLKANEASDITLKQFLNNSFMGLALQGTYGISPCYIDDIKGELSRSENQFKFTPHEFPETDVEITRPYQLVGEGTRLTSKNINVIWVGTNDGSTSTVEEIIKKQKYMVNHLEKDRYIIISLISKKYNENVDSYNSKMAEEWGIHFLNIRDYLIDYGLYDCNITPTEQDLSDIEDREIPSSLRNDAVHLNVSGYSVVAKLLYEKLLNLGYLIN